MLETVKETQVYVACKGALFSVYLICNIYHLNPQLLSKVFFDKWKFDHWNLKFFEICVG